MKKIVAIGLCLVVFAVSASAQQAGNRIRKERSEQGSNRGHINRAERTHLKKDMARTHVARKHANRDGRVNPMERKRIHKMRKHNRHDAFRFKHNRSRHHRRVI